jgi:hypothetical protein
LPPILNPHFLDRFWTRVLGLGAGITEASRNKIRETPIQCKLQYKINYLTPPETGIPQHCKLLYKMNSLTLGTKSGMLKTLNICINKNLGPSKQGQGNPERCTSKLSCKINCVTLETMSGKPQNIIYHHTKQMCCASKQGQETQKRCNDSRNRVTEPQNAVNYHTQPIS